MTKTDILDAINRLLVERWPTRTVYVDVCPVDFERPSFWLAVEKHDLNDAARDLVRHDLTLRLTLYDRVDKAYEASWYRLSKETDTVVGLLLPPLAVGDRRVHLKLKELPREADRAFLRMETSWLDYREEEKASSPVATNYSIRVDAE